MLIISSKKKKINLNLKDYINILDLIPNKKLPYREQLYATGRNLVPLFNQYVEKIKRNSNASLTQIANNLEISIKQFRKWRNGMSPIPLRILQNFSGENINVKKSFENAIDYISSSRGIRVKIPQQISPLLLEIFGRFSGDGSIGAYKNGEYRFRLKEEGKQLVKQHLIDMNRIFEINGTYTDYGNYAQAEILSKPLVRLFQQIFDYDDDFNKTYYGKPPPLLKNTEWYLRKYYTTGLIDTEGSFYYTNQSYYFEIHMVNKYFINEVAEAFNAVGLQYNYYKLPNKTIRIRCYNRINCNLIKNIFEIKNDKHLTKLKSWGI